jgi:hypothetical protein
MQPPKLEASSLFQEQTRKDQMRCEIYNTILSQVHHKIKVTNKLSGNNQQLIYVVPEFIPGVPRFDMKECIIYLAYNLRASSFTVNYTHPNILYISWREHAKNYRLNESPYTRTLIQVTEHSITKQLHAAAAQAESNGEKPKKSGVRKTSEYKTSNMLGFGTNENNNNNSSNEKEVKNVHFI